MYFTDSNGCTTVVEDGDEKEICVTLADILIFATGAAEIPPIGFTEQPTVNFQPRDGEGCLFPRASTCTNVLFLPTSHETFETFKYYMLSGIAGAVGFGTV